MYICNTNAKLHTMIYRNITSHLKEMLTKFPVVSLTGPRQSGKTTLLREIFKDFRYVNLERIDLREIIYADPAGFLNNNGPGVIFDEAQNLPELFSYIQVITDDRNSNGQYILSGSQSFLLNEQISQSLAGRVSVNHLFPFDITEINKEGSRQVNDLIVKGLYPRLHAGDILPEDFYPSYLQTYIERDIRSLKQIGNLQSFARFLGLCAGRTGQILNLTSLANDAGISVNTAKSWLSMLQASFIVFLLQPWHRNFNKRIIKAPKLYFYDTGIVSSLLRINKPDVLKEHYIYGFLFENLIISEIIKYQVHRGIRPSVYYWKESNGVEIDCIIENRDSTITALEIKAGQTFSSGYLRNLDRFPADDRAGEIRKTILYNGASSHRIKETEIITWQEFPEFLHNLIS